MSRIIGIPVGTPISPQVAIEKTAQAKTIEENAAHTKNTAIHVTAAEKQTWNNKSNFSGKFADLSNKPTTLSGYGITDAATKAEINNLSQEIVDQQAELDEYESLTLGVHTDGLIYLFKNGLPKGNGLEIKADVVEGDVVGYIDENNNIVLSGALPEETYTVKYETEDGSLIDIGELSLGEIVEIINQIPISQNADGSLFVGTNGEKGYKTDTRISGSSGNESSQTGTETTGFIPITYNDTVYIENIVDDGSRVMGVYDSNHAKLITTALGNIGTFDGGIISFKMSSSVFSSATSTNFAYIRISASEITADSIVTVNQPIV